MALGNLEAVCVRLTLVMPSSCERDSKARPDELRKLEERWLKL